MSGHTRGPWRLVEDFDDCGSSRQRVYSVRAADRTDQGHVYEFAGLARIPACDGDERLEANARLIAASPVLLEALVELTNVLAGDPLDRDAVVPSYEKARAAIALAKGSEND